MNRKKLNPSEGELLASAKDALKWKKLLDLDISPIEEGYYTAKEIAVFIGYKSTATKDFITRKIAEGKCTMKEFLILMNDKKRLIPHYKINELNENL
jgi:hypothetical protein